MSSLVQIDSLRLAQCQKPSERIMLNAIVFFLLALAIAVVVFGRLGKILRFDFRLTVLSVSLAFLALLYLYWKSRP